MTTSIKALGEQLRDDDLQVARAAAHALGEIGGTLAIDLLVEVANSQKGPIVAVCAQLLASMDRSVEIRGVRDSQGRWARTTRRWCECGGLLNWGLRGQHELLICEVCRAEHVLSPAGQLFKADGTPFGCCCCCCRQAPLVRMERADTLFCPVSQRVHIRPYDFPRQLRLIEELPHGACSCCSEPQPLIRVDGVIRCYRSRKSYLATPHGFSAGAAPLPAPAAVAAINEALIRGTLSIGESGLVVPDDDEPEDGQDS